MDPNFVKHVEDMAGGDNTARPQAEAVSQQQIATNMGPYLKNLALALLSPSISEMGRQLSGLVIKNAVYGQSESTRRQHQQHWLEIPSQLRGEIKAALINGISVDSKPARKGACSAIASIALAELSVNEWQDLIPNLVGAVETSGNPVLQSSALLIMGILCEDIDPIPHNLMEKSVDLIKALSCGAQPDKQIEVRRESIKSLIGVLSVVSPVFDEKSQRDFVMTMICNACKENDEEIQSSAMQCLVKVAELYYDQLEQEYMVAIWQITSTLMVTDSDVAPLTIEFWSTIAEMERDRIEEFEDAEVKNFTATVLPMIIPNLCKNLLQQVEDTEDDDEWNNASASAACVTVMAECVKDPIVPVIKPFILQINDANWRQREASTMALGSIMFGPDEAFETLIADAIPILLEHLGSDPHPCVRATSAWALSRIAAHEDHCHEIEQFGSNTVIRVLVKALESTDSVIAYYSCFALLNILTNIYGDEMDDTTNELCGIFLPLFNALNAAAERSDTSGNKLRITAYETINILIGVAPMDCVPKIKQLIGPFVARLEQSFNLSTDADLQKELQAYIPLVLQTITNRVAGEIAPYASNMYATYVKVFESRKIIVDEVMNAISTLFQVCPEFIPHVIESFVPYFLTAIQNFEEVSVLKSGLICLGAMCDSLGENFFHVPNNFCNQTLENLIKHLQNPAVDQTLKPLIITSFADIAIAISGQFQIYFPHIMNVLVAASSTTISPDDTEEYADYVIDLREAILDAYPPVIEAMTNANKQAEFVPYLNQLLPFMGLLWNEREHRTPTIVSYMVGLLGDILQNIVPVMAPSDSAKLLSLDFISQMLYHGVNNSPNPETRQTATWAQQQLEAVRQR